MFPLSKYPTRVRPHVVGVGLPVGLALVTVAGLGVFAMYRKPGQPGSSSTDPDGAARRCGATGEPDRQRAGFYRRWGKRALDLVLSALGLLLLSPVLVTIAALLRIKLGAPVLFRHERPGLHARPFTLYKFRTMTDERDEQGNPLPDDERLTRLGEFLRRTSLDELPELLNVLRGDMSLVGPRPLIFRYLDRYTPEQARRHLARPGITGLAQISGRNALPWGERFALDVWYVDHLSLLLDLRILALTVWKVLRREGISEEGHVTMSEFMGSGSNAPTDAAR